jgi:hypothetical protein
MGLSLEIDQFFQEARRQVTERGEPRHGEYYFNGRFLDYFLAPYFEAEGEIQGVV